MPPQPNLIATTTLYSNKLRKSGDCSDDLADRILACFLSRIRNHRAGHVLHLTHAQTGRHHAHARPHDPTHCSSHHPAGVAFTRGLLHHRLGSRKFGQQWLHLVSWAFLDQKFEDDADGFFRSRTIHPDSTDQTCDQLVHYSLASPARSARHEHIAGSKAGVTSRRSSNVLKRCKLATRGNRERMTRPAVADYKISDVGERRLRQCACVPGIDQL